MIKVNNILLIYHHPFKDNAPTIKEHVGAFAKFSKFKITTYNTAMGYPAELGNIGFSAIVMHYSLFGSHPFKLSDNFIEYISNSNSKKIMFFQDEMQYVAERLSLINKLGCKTIYTLLEKRYFEEVYLNNTNADIINQTLTGYVSDDLKQKSQKNYISFSQRSIDVGYRARNLEFYFGQGAREKTDIAERFLVSSKSKKLNLDISTKEEDRIYGENWYKFVSDCKFMLGVMAGTSIFDYTGKIKEKTNNYLKKFPNADFEEVQNNLLIPYEGNINYRTISPRIFECAAFKVCMILYRDDYQGVLKADKHYIPLEKDFSNINEVLKKMEDSSFVSTMVETTYSDIIEDNKWHYKEFISEFDNMLIGKGLKPLANSDADKKIN